ncbi:MAG: TonB-dependent receptor [Bacteroidota bacterium]
MRVLSLVALMLLLSVLQAAGQDNLLDRRITIGLKGQTVKEALKAISEQTGLKINYLSTDIPEGREVTRTYKKARLGDVIRDVWGDERLLLRAFGSSIIIQSNANPPEKKGKGGIRGTVTNNDGEPVAFATVGVLGSNKGVVTDEAGRFIVDQIEEGQNVLGISSLAYEPLEVNVEVLPNRIINADIKLQTSVNALEEVVVEGRSARAEALIQSAQAVTVVETRLAKVQTADLGEVMARTQGVNIQRSGGLGSSTQFSLNGLSGDQIRTFQDGIPLASMGYINGLANVPVNLIERVEIYRGVVPIRFGADALGGAVNIVSNEAFEGTGGDLSYQTGSFGTHRLAANINHRPKGKSHFINASGFLDRAKNNYKIDVEIPDARGRLTPQTVERFHDDYLARGGNFELGIRNKNWADLLTIRGFYTQIDQDLQHNFAMTVPYGEVTTGGSSFGGLLKWDKSWNDKWSLENTVGVARNGRQVLDTATVIYTWNGELSTDLNGEVIRRDGPGERGASDIDFRDLRYYNRFYLEYAINQNHKIRLSSAPTNEERGGENALTPEDQQDPLNLENRLFNVINGVEYEFESSNDKISILSFAKNYIQHLTAELFDDVGAVTQNNRSTNSFGAGISFRHNLTKKWNIKASYERAIRLPNFFEVFGNGLFIAKNLDLKPERSHNANLSANFQSANARRAQIRLELNLFLRQVEDFIQLLGTNNFSSHANIAGVASKGLEFSSNWTSANQKINMTASGTYISYINSSTTGTYAAFNGDRLPNRPYFFGSYSGRYSFKNIFSRKDGLVVFINTRFVNQFFRAWESAGRRDSKQVIPTQFTQNAGVTYHTVLGTRKLSLTAEIQNISNAKVFDFFGVQRPGRAFYFKSIFNF